MSTPTKYPWECCSARVMRGSIEEMLTGCGLYWKVSKVAPVVQTSIGLIPVPGVNVMVRSDGFVLGRSRLSAIRKIGGESKLPQNEDVFGTFIRYMTTMDEGKPIVPHTAGCTQDGAKVFLMGKAPWEITLGAGGDVLDVYVMMTFAHALSSGYQGRDYNKRTSVDLIIARRADKTYSMFNYDEFKRVRMPSLQRWDEESVKFSSEIVRLTNQKMRDLEKKISILARTEVDDKTAVEYLYHSYSQGQTRIVKRGTGGGVPKNLPFLVMQMYVHYKAENLSSSRGTWWGLLCAVNYYYDHLKARKGEQEALERCWYGTSRFYKEKAFNRAFARCTGVEEITKRQNKIPNESIQVTEEPKHAHHGADQAAAPVCEAGSDPAPVTVSTPLATGCNPDAVVRDPQPDNRLQGAGGSVPHDQR